MLHIVFFLALFSLCLDFSSIRCIMVLLHSLIYQASVLSAVECLVYASLMIMVLLHSLIYQASVMSAVECLVYASLKALYICLLIIILLSSLSVAQVNVLGVCFWPIFRQHRNYLF